LAAERPAVNSKNGGGKNIMKRAERGRVVLTRTVQRLVDFYPASERA